MGVAAEEEEEEERIHQESGSGGFVRCQILC